MYTAMIAEVLHAKDPARFAALMAQLLETGLLDPRAEGSSFEPVDGRVAVRRCRRQSAKQAA